MIKKFRPVLLTLPAITLGACGASSAGSSEPPNDYVHGNSTKKMSNAEVKQTLPYARGNNFRSLNEYLSYLQRYNAPLDLPYWRLIAPDRYEWVTTIKSLNPDKTRQIATREELMERYGFEE
jgi:hypothetical protein